MDLRSLRFVEVMGARISATRSLLHSWLAIGKIQTQPSYAVVSFNMNHCHISVYRLYVSIISWLNFSSCVCRFVPWGD